MEREHLVRLDTGADGVQVVEPFRELRTLQGDVVIEHGLSELAPDRVGHVEQLRPAMHADRELLTRHVCRAYGRARREVAHPDGVWRGAEEERAMQEVTVDRSGQWPA